jgi:putative sterol carrier protein
MRFDLENAGSVEHWLVELGKGAPKVSHKLAKADAVHRSKKSLFDDVVSGRANAMAAVLRGAITVEGDLGLAMAFQRLFPGETRPPQL